MKKIFLCVIAVFLVSCRGETKEEEKKIAFENESYEVAVDKTVTAALNDIEADYKFFVTSEKICKIDSSDNYSCVLKGIKDGYTILNAENKESKVQALLHVYDENKEEESRRVKGNESKYYLCTVYTKHYGESFIVKGKTEISLEDKNVVLMYEDKIKKINAKDFISFEYEEYDFESKNLKNK